jgi:hypothetical protein
MHIGGHSPLKSNSTYPLNKEGEAGVCACSAHTPIPNY